MRCSILLILSLAACGVESKGSGPTIHFVSNEDSQSTVRVSNLSRDWLAKIASEDPSPDEWQKILAVYVFDESDSEEADRPPVWGAHSIEGDSLVFQARFPFEPGLRYKAVFDPARAPIQGKPGGPGAGNEIQSVIFRIPKLEDAAPTVVEQVFPTTALLPENQLKFYIHFSAPMSRGEAYSRIHLLDASQTEVHLPFLELDEELWDGAGKRLTILFDPGRIKRGLLPRKEVGTAIHEGKKYTLLIDREWRDARGNPLQDSFKKSFRVGPPDRQPPDVKSWNLTPPESGTSSPLVVRFPEPMDRALLFRLLDVTDARSTPIGGSIHIDLHETRWRFSPDEPWRKGNYFLAVATILEDLAGNTLSRPFDLDLLEREEERIAGETVRVAFTVSAQRKPD